MLAGYLKFSGSLFYSELDLNQYSVGSPCRTICTVCGSLPCPDLNLIHYTNIILQKNHSPLKHTRKWPLIRSNGIEDVLCSGNGNGAHDVVGNVAISCQLCFGSVIFQVVFV